jgi:hypothetical protein
VSPTSAVIIGVIAGVLVCGGVLFNERVLRVDDPCVAGSVHGYCGWFGAVAVGIFADGSYGAAWNGVGASTYFGVAGRGVSGLLHGDLTQFPCSLPARRSSRFTPLEDVRCVHRSQSPVAVTRVAGIRARGRRHPRVRHGSLSDADGAGERGLIRRSLAGCRTGIRQAHG